MSEDNKKSKLINITIHILMVLLFLPLLLPLILLCLVSLCLPLFVCSALVYTIYCEGLFVSMPWIAWLISIWIISIGLFGTITMIYDTFYRYEN